MDNRRFVRTSKGHDEISSGNKTLKGKLRTVLFLVDPNKVADVIQEQVAQIGAPPDSLAQLLALGFIDVLGNAPAPAPGTAAAPAQATFSPGDEVSNFRVAKAFMNDTIVDALGIRAFMFTLRLERCATRADLVALLPDYTESLVKKLERPAARALVERTRELLTMGSA